MRKRSIKELLLSLSLFTAPLVAKDISPIQIELKNPSFTRRGAFTNDGGIISTEGLRIQAKQLEYLDDKESDEHIIRAEGDLLVEYYGYFFVGDCLTYDFEAKHGFLTGGKGLFGIWFAGGDTIELLPDGTFIVHEAYLTTSEGENYAWALKANEVKVRSDMLLTANNIRFTTGNFPVFWFPFFAYNMRKDADPLVRYSLAWDKSLGPRIGARYKLFSSDISDFFFRFDYRWATGWGGSIETEYYSDDGRTTLVTRSYGARYKTVPDQTTKGRFRLQGLFDTKSFDGRTKVHATYDRVSDEKMFEGFMTDDFEVSTQKKTLFSLDHQEDSLIAAVRVQPRINPFDSINQQLPFVSFASRPVSIGNTGILMENEMSAGFLDYSYASDIREFIPEPNAVRFETKQLFYWPIPIRSFTLTPRIGAAAIFYSNSPQKEKVGQAILAYGFETSTRLYRSYEDLTHVIVPYLNFEGTSPPLSPVDCHFTFNIDDGLDQLNLFRLGFRNNFYTSESQFAPTYTFDLFTYGFIDQVTFNDVFPRIYGNFSMHRKNVLFQTEIAWNIEEMTLDHSNFRLNWTIDENFALSAEFRHRSKYDWRKSNYENFALEFARPLDELLCSPLSDGRNTFLAKMQLRFLPGWVCQFQSHFGWGRASEPRYNAVKIDFFSEIASHWQMRLGYEHLPNDDRFTYGLKLVK